MSDDRISATIAHLYIESVDKHRDRLKMCLHDEAILNWFGRTLIGCEEIISFFNVTIPNTIHYVYDAKSSPPKHTVSTDINNNEVVVDNPVVTLNCTLPLKRPNPLPNDNELQDHMVLINILAGIDNVKAGNFVNSSTKIPKLSPNFVTPSDGCNKILLPQNGESRTLDNSDVKGIIIKASLYLRSKHRPSNIWERKLDHIYLEYAGSSIKTIIYKGASTCRKNLSKLFSEM